MAIIYPFCSSSKGNCTILAAEGRAILIDCGVSCAQIKRALSELDLSLSELDGVLLTHEHSDHIKAIPQLEKQCHPTFYAGGGTLQALDLEGIDHQNEPFDVGPFHIIPILTSHDAASPCGYRIEDETGALAIVTDTGKITADMHHQLTGCRFVMLESNYDPEMLLLGPYPPALKNRIQSASGHLSNQDCASLLALMALEGELKTVVLAHLSDHNNTPLTARSATMAAFDQYGIEGVQVEVGGPFCPILEV